MLFKEISNVYPSYETHKYIVSRIQLIVKADGTSPIVAIGL